MLTGEGADELFAGYAYHKLIEEPQALAAELVRSLRNLHNINLQRVDRLTMAHSLEGRVPFLDLEVIETALSIPAELELPSFGGHEKWLLRAAVEDLLPHDIVWRGKAQFDEGTGIADLLPSLTSHLAAKLDASTYATRFTEARLRSPEECVYHQLLRESADNPESLLANVGRWAARS